MNVQQTISNLMLSETLSSTNEDKLEKPLSIPFNYNAVLSIAKILSDATHPDSEQLNTIADHLLKDRPNISRDDSCQSYNVSHYNNLYSADDDEEYSDYEYGSDWEEEEETEEYKLEKLEWLRTHSMDIKLGSHSNQEDNKLADIAGHENALLNYAQVTYVPDQQFRDSEELLKPMELEQYTCEQQCYANIVLSELSDIAMSTQIMLHSSLQHVQPKTDFEDELHISYQDSGTASSDYILQSFENVDVIVPNIQFPAFLLPLGESLTVMNDQDSLDHVNGRFKEVQTDIPKCHTTRKKVKIKYKRLLV